MGARRAFEVSLQQRIIFEKLGIHHSVEVMTIHKAKGREFNGVVLVFEDNYKALWKAGSLTADAELVDLYRVAISRARDVIGIIAYNDTIDHVRVEVRKLLAGPF
ncbi:MAG TPA: 3'-5' exonuclease, partial [Candidatus Hodarchaeales archaeon]|nr:3'-5' exonuclease [Candidatus Hodarchaeales archaeon]